MSIERQIRETTEVRRHNGQCAFGSWQSLNDDDIPASVVSAVIAEVGEAICRDIRHETGMENTDESGMVIVGGHYWIYRR